MENDTPMTDQLGQLQQRLQNLEDLRAIEDLQYSYWEHVDLQQPDRLRDLFHPDGINIDFQDMPLWTTRDSFVEFYSRLGCNPDRIETHHGVAPRIRLTGPNSAAGTWRLRMVAFNMASRTIVRIGGEYAADYVRSEGRWWIKAMKFTRRTLQSVQVTESGAMVSSGFGTASPEASAHLFGPAD
jgi:hypothetical protein